MAYHAIVLKYVFWYAPSLLLGTHKPEVGLETNPFAD
jgi:hypothetical protein